MKENISVTVIVPRWNYVQISTHGCHYNCPTKIVDGVSYFKFKQVWHKIDDYTNEYTRVNNI